MEEINGLIERLKHGILKNSSYISSIKHPKMLISSLEELRDLIGNDKIKDSIAIQISHLIMTKKRAKDGIIKEDDVMLNTVLYGPPGVGKTLIGTKLAKIWYSLGYIDGSRNPKKKGEITNMLRDMIKDNKDGIDDDPYMIYYLLMIFVGFLFAGLSMAWSFYSKFGAAWTVGTVAIIFVLLFLVWFLLTGALYEDKENKNVNNITTVNNTIKELKEQKESFSKVLKDEDLIKIVTRDDFVDRYVGWTAPKTRKLLEENVGKVLFIDEAYSLINGPHDEFGMEALTTINLFMSQRPKEIIIIMGGYKDLLANGPFSVQPGLKRRFMWQFECKGYNSQELFDIFTFQLNKKGWGLTDTDETKRLFSEYHRCFPAYGGDTERAGFLAELEHSRDYMGNSENMEISKLSPDHVKRGILKLQENSIEDDGESSNPISNVMKMFQKGGKKNDEFMEKFMDRTVNTATR